MNSLAFPFVALAVLSACAAGNPRPAPGTPTTAATKIPAQPSPIGRMARIPEATYRMGSEVGEPDERPQHEVHVAAFDMELTEVTVAEYAQCVEARACVVAKREVAWPGVTEPDQQLYAGECNGNRPDRQDHPVNCVDWSMADAYCRWAGKRLPTEEEWEYAACGGNCAEGTESQTGRSAIRLGVERWPFTSRVATGWPGPFGLYDLAGNVWEWTASPYCTYDHPGCSDSRRVVRGGSWSHFFVRLTDRSPGDPSTRSTDLGFRCARSSSP
jgi:sulfatase modifying factor 1